MSDSSSPILSVRGDARRSVVPDFARLAGVISVSGETKREAVGDAASTLKLLTADLAAMGAVPLGVETERSSFTWSAHSATTHVERQRNDPKGRNEPTGRITATVAVTITVRALDLLDRLGVVIAGHETFSVHHVNWHVDPDNPAWPDVRAEAIQAAVRKARDYAAALGGSLHRVEEIADVGLLSGDTAEFRSSVRATAFGTPMPPPGGPPGSGAGDDIDAPSLDPIPQELRATIEARFSATGVFIA